MSDNKKQVIELILGIRSESNRKSTLQLALQKARRLAGINAGEEANHNMFITRRSLKESDAKDIVDSFFVAAKNDEEEMDVLTSLCLYLIVLDQLGHIFGERCSGSNRTRVAIERSKIGLSQNCIKSIKNLRNSINHNFGLACYDERKNLGIEKYTIVFNDDGKNKPVVESNKKWLGNWCDKDDETSTCVYPFSLMNFIESVLNSYIKQYNVGEVDSPLCLEELKTRFTIVINVD